MIPATFRKIASGNASRRGGMAIFAFTARSLEQVSMLVITLLAARFLTPSEYGVYALGIVFMTLIQTLSYSGFYNFVVTSKAPDRQVLSVSFWMIIGIATAAALIICAIAYPLEWLFEAPDLGHVLILLALSQPIASFGAWASASLLRAQNVKANFTVMFVQNLVALLAGVLLLTLWQSIYALVAFRYAKILTGAALYIFYGIRFIAEKLDRALLREAVKYSSSLYGSRLLAFLSKYAGDILLGIHFTTAEVGLYRFGTRVATSVTDSMVHPMSNFAITQFSARTRADRPISDALQRFAGTIALLTGLASAFLIVFAADAIELFFQDAYLAAVVVTYAIAARAVASVGQVLMEPVFSSIGRPAWVMTYNFVTAIGAVLAVVAAAPMGLTVLAWTQAGVALAASLFAFALMRWKADLAVGGTLRSFFVGAALAIAYGVLIELLRDQVLVHLALDGLALLSVDVLVAVLLVPLFLFVGARLGVFRLSVFSG